MRLRLTQQALDPIGGIAATRITAIGAMLAVLLTGVQTWLHWGEVRFPLAAVLGILLVVAAGVAAVAGAAPARAPYTPERLALVVTLAVGAAIAEYLSTVGRNLYLYDDYGPAVVGMLILALAPFNTWRWILSAGLIASGVISILVMGASATTATGAPLVSLIVVNASVVLALTAAGAAYSYTIVQRILGWQRAANREMLRRDALDRSALAGVEPSRITVLGAEVLPFLARVMTSERVGVHDVDRARELAEALRRALREGIEATWLDDLAVSLASARGIRVDVVDRDGDATRFNDDQRAAVSALVTWLCGDGRAKAVSIGLERAADEPRGTVEIVAEAGDWQPVRREIERFVSVARIVGLRARHTRTGRMSGWSWTMALSSAALSSAALSEPGSSDVR
ncbi:hypothetical protein ET445_16650 [Agromyces protaetiae]|uniref:Uncharacterized protein n=1 Tax=Agromyces protaetiae TaxID=2509455 RepID=A0A4P6FFI9_9MICO|nr:hypothetical protein [Agromyces protaetiae]QAY74724.1 hypothetical protein ET445_16650 [Agromyces protaetiae]